MRILQKAVVFVLISILIAAIFASCDDKAKEDVKKAVKVYADPLTVRFAFSNFQNETAIDKNILTEIEDRTKDTLNLKLEFTDFSDMEYTESESKYYGKITSLIEDDGTDVIGVDGNLSSLVNRGLLMDISDLLPKYAPNLYKSFTPEQLAAGTYNGRLYMIPGRKNGSARPAVLVRKELVERFDLQPIKTFDDYECFLELIKKEVPGCYPASNIFISPYAFIMASGYFRADEDMVYKWNDPDMTLIPVEQTEAYYEAMTRLIKWNKNGYFVNTHLTPEQNFKSDNIASIMLSLGPAIDYLKSYGLSDKFVIYPLNPQIYAEGGNGSSGGIALTKTADGPERIIMLLEWIYSAQENYDLLMYGIKGKDYTLKDERVVMPEGKTYRSWCGSDYFFNSKYMRLFNNDPAELKAYYSGELDPRTIIPPHKGFKPELGKMQTLVEKRNKLMGERWGVIMGTSDITLNNYINALKKAGAITLRDEIQKQLDKWIKERD